MCKGWWDNDWSALERPRGRYAARPPASLEAEAEAEAEAGAEAEAEPRAAASPYTRSGAGRGERHYTAREWRADVRPTRTNGIFN